MKASKTIFNFNHIDNKLTEAEISELKALYKFYHKKILAIQNDIQIFRKNGPDM